MVSIDHHWLLVLEQLYADDQVKDKNLIGVKQALEGEFKNQCSNCYTIFNKGGLFKHEQLCASNKILAKRWTLLSLDSQLTFLCQVGCAFWAKRKEDILRHYA